MSDLKTALKKLEQEIRVAASGFVDRPDVCRHCATPMFFRQEEGRIVSSFCPSHTCLVYLREIPE